MNRNRLINHHFTQWPGNLAFAGVTPHFNTEVPVKYWQVWVEFNHMKRQVPKPKLDSYSLLVDAVLDEDLEAIRRLVAKGTNVNDANASGETPLTWAASRNNLRAARLLVQLGADVNKKMNDGMTALDVAVCWSSPKFREWLRSVGGVRGWNFDEWPWPPPKKPRIPK